MEVITLAIKMNGGKAHILKTKRQQESKQPDLDNRTNN